MMKRKLILILVLCSVIFIAASTNTYTIFDNGIGVTSTDGIVLSNTTTATLGNQQWSPRLRFNGRGFTGARGAPFPSFSDDYFLENRTSSSASVTTPGWLTLSYLQQGGSTQNLWETQVTAATGTFFLAIDPVGLVIGSATPSTGAAGTRTLIEGGNAIAGSGANGGNVLFLPGSQDGGGTYGIIGMNADNTYDFGSTAASRPRSYYAGTSFIGPGFILGANLTQQGSGAHINQFDNTSDIAGTITITSPATTGTYTYATAYASAPVCVLTPTSDPTTAAFFWATATTTVLTANIKVTQTITFNFQCVGNPN